MRIGPDVAPHWEPRPKPRVPGIEGTAPSVANALRNIFARAWMHRRLWLNDPDCLMVRARDTDLTGDEIRSLAGAIGASGGMVVVSDDVAELGPEELALLRETLALAREVDAGGVQGTARALALLDGETPRGPGEPHDRRGGGRSS